MTSSIIERAIDSTKEKFWDAVALYHRFPQSVNKQVSGVVTLFSARLLCSRETSLVVFESLKTVLENHIKSTALSADSIFNILRETEFRNEILTLDSVDVFKETDGLYLTVRALLPKMTHLSGVSTFYEVSLVDKNQTELTICSMGDRFHFDIATEGEREHKIQKLENSTMAEKPKFIILKYKYLKLHFQNNNLKMYYSEDASDKEIKWLHILFDKMCKSMLNNSRSNEPEYARLASNEDYYILYNNMKSKYAKYLVDNWTETTDPIRKVFEDIGVATYLMLLWKNKEKPQRFVDLGCGNGILVHLLNSEGHEGIGYDVKKRKLWDLYPSSTKLEIKEIIPSQNTVYPEADWLIGNHSDELTAWIPIMAARSNATCQYFVLPCCPYELSGQKFQRRNSGVSSYSDFLKYVQTVSGVCGFECFVDKLKVVSTKRICIVGNKRTKMDCDAKLSQFIQKEFYLSKTKNDKTVVMSDTNTTDSGNWITEFKVRNPVEKVRNCTQIAKPIINEILLDISAILLQETNNLKIMKNNTELTWNRGGRLKLDIIAKSLSTDKLKHLKQECKGIQTLLRNHHFVFQLDNGYVQLRDVDSMKKASENILNSDKQWRWKQKTCWFYDNHPNSCPLEDKICSYKHAKL